MSIVKPLYGSNNVAIACTLASLASAAFRASAAVDNTTNLYDDVKVQFTLHSAASGTIGPSPVVNVYLAESANGGTTYSDGLAAGDGLVTPTNPPNLKLLYTLNTPVVNTAYTSDPFYVRSAAGISEMPDHWFLVFQNLTGLALGATASTLFYEGLNPQII